MTSPPSKCSVLVLGLLCLFWLLLHLTNTNQLFTSRPKFSKLWRNPKIASFFSEADLEDAKPPVKVLLVAYHRSGSSFTGGLLSAGLLASFYFEPLHSGYPPWILKSLNETKKTNSGNNEWGTDVGGADLVREMLTGIFSCSRDLIDWLSRSGWGRIVRKRGRECSSSKTLVVKTIRAHRDSLLPWIVDTDIKVVHLVRDPRGMKNSASDLGWAAKCRVMREDLDLERHLPANRYTHVRYEDLVDQTEATLFSLYSQLGIQWTRHVRSTVYNLTHAEENKERKESYYSTFRKSSFRHDHWKDRLTRLQVEDIERDCSDFMDLMGYKKLDNMTSSSTVLATKTDISST